MSQVKVSIIIPCFNEEKNLPVVLESVLKQDYSDYEVILVDNNSTDNTKNIILEFQKNNDKIRYVFESYRSRGAARNTGEKMASGEIILMTDADCQVPPNWISEMIEPIINGGFAGVQGIDEHVDLRVRDTYTIALIGQREVIGGINTNNFAIKAETLRLAGFSGRKYFRANDSELSIRLHENNAKIKFLDFKVRHYYDLKLGRIIKKYFEEGFWQAIVAYDHREYLKKTNFRQKTNQTGWSFIKIFPGLVRTAFSAGPKKAYYDALTGIPWRAGLVCAWIKLYFLGKKI
ncbi:MAG: glycosyltransferase [Patescibacteria group bacterium]|jgi:glycosyltransferase involved in cell wall biosynthesis